MLLIGLDIGNSHTVVGLWHNSTLITTGRFITNTSISIQEWATILTEWVQQVDYPLPKDNFHAVYASVVTNIDATIEQALKLLPCKSILVCNSQQPLPFTFNYPSFLTLGADRIANAISSTILYGSNTIIVDFGTAITFCLIIDNIYEGGAIVPGFDTALKSLHQNTSKLPYVKLNQNEPLPAKNTINAIQAGIYHGWKGLVSNIIINLQNYALETKKIHSKSDIKIIATGGIIEDLMFAHELFDIVDKNLTLKGLYHLHLLHQKFST